MKKLVVVVATVVAVLSGKAASVDWKVAGTAATKGYTVYVLSSLADNYESVSAIASAAVGVGTIATVGRETKASGTAAGDSVTAESMKNAYYVIVESDSATSYTYYKIDMSAMVYDPTNQQSSPGSFTSVNAATILSSGTSANFAAVPEPTSGLLMLLGVAGLALRRRRA